MNLLGCSDLAGPFLLGLGLRLIHSRSVWELLCRLVFLAKCAERHPESEDCEKPDGAVHMLSVAGSSLYLSELTALATNLPIFANKFETIATQYSTMYCLGQW